ncbi:32_t:CDS:2 [Gigaspora rosea]|nr:32_t:CDS:2 [Gigaspora rosea]
MSKAVSKEETKTPKENNLVKIKSFCGTNDKDPFDYLKETAAKWYRENEEDIKYWKTKDKRNEDKSFYYLFAKEFAPEKRQHHWQIELYGLRQKEFKKLAFMLLSLKNCLVELISVINFLIVMW